MGVLATNVASGNIKNCKEASRNKGQLSLELPDHKVPPDILHPLQLVQGYTFHGRCCDVAEVSPKLSAVRNVATSLFAST
jgi:hypothetical protein